jgi:hypothetical protein
MYHNDEISIIYVGIFRLQKLIVRLKKCNYTSLEQVNDKSR